MNKTLLLLIAGIVVVGGMVGYTVLNKSDSAHTAGDGHTEVEHSEAAGHTAGDGHTETDHSQTVESAPHDDSGTATHID